MTSDKTLVKRVQDNEDADAAKELIARHSGIYVKMVRSFTPDGSFAQQDALGEKDSRIYEAAKDFDPNRGTKFSTYLANTVRWRCLNQTNRAARFPHVSLQSYSNAARPDFLEQTMDSEMISLVFKQAELHPDARVKKIVDMRYKNGHNKTSRSWKAIASKLGMSVQGVINIHNRFIKQLTTKLHV